VPRALTERLLLDASATAPATVTVLTSAPAAPITRLALKLGRELRVTALAVLLLLMVSEPVGLAKSVCGIVEAVRRERVLVAIPSSPKVSVLAGDAARFTAISEIVPAPVFVLANCSVWLKKTEPK